MFPMVLSHLGEIIWVIIWEWFSEHLEQRNYSILLCWGLLVLLQEEKAQVVKITPEYKKHEEDIPDTSLGKIYN